MEPRYLGRKYVACTNLRTEPVPAALDDAGKGKLAAMEGDVLLNPAAGARRLAEDLATLPQAGVRARRGLQLADDVDNLSREGLKKVIES